jgi:hypothetical protein
MNTLITDYGASISRDNNAPAIQRAINSVIDRKFNRGSASRGIMPEKLGGGIIAVKVKFPLVGFCDEAVRWL